MIPITHILSPEQEQAEALSGQRAHLARRDYKAASRYMRSYMETRGRWLARRRLFRILKRKRKRWNGRLVFRFVCAGCGKERWAPEAVMWAVASLDNMWCRWCLHNGPPADDGQQLLFTGDDNEWRHEH